MVCTYGRLSGVDLPLCASFLGGCESHGHASNMDVPSVCIGAMVVM